MGKSRFGVVVGIAALALVVPAVAAGGGFDVKAGHYRGQVGFGSERVHFTVSKREVVKDVSFEEITGSDSSCLQTFTLKRRDKINADGEFEVVGRRARITGRFVTKQKARGHVFAEARGCGKAHDLYHAHRVPGK